MHNKYTKLKIIILSILLSLQVAMAIPEVCLSALSDSQACLLAVKRESELRWEKVVEAKKVFVPYDRKSSEEVLNEFRSLNKFRNELWYSNPNEVLLVANPDYIKAEITNNAGSYTSLAFKYNCLDEFYNASTIFINGHHFVALREPKLVTIQDFFRVLMNQKVSILVRLNSEEEYFSHHNFCYWKEYIFKALDDVFIQPKVMEEDGEKLGLPIPYFYTNEWEDHEAVDAAELYRLVQDVRRAYEKIQNPGPIACHCKAGLGRTGTFIAAYVLAHMLDVLDPNEISIEAIVLKISTQRPKTIGWEKQYLLLYQFCDYYLAKQKVADKDEF